MKLSVYRWITQFASPLIDVYLHRRLKIGKEDPDRFSERLGKPGRPRPKGPLIWVHGASVGESLSALPLIRAIRNQWSHVSVLVTTGTVTSAALIQERLPDGAFHQYIPVDRRSGIMPFFDHWQPDFILWMESEFWPNLLIEASSRNIPMVLINGRVSDRSFRRWSKNRSMINDLLSCFTLCLGQTPKDTERLKDLGAQSAAFLGNIKGAADPLPVDDDELLRLKNMIGKRPIWLAASTHPGEEILCQHVHHALQNRWPEILTIIVPRHPERGPDIKRQLEDDGVNQIGLRSKGDPISQDTDIYVADTIGELGLFYRLTQVAFIGKTLGADGGQNPLEAAQLGTPIIFGPNMSNFQEMASALLSAGAAKQIDSVDTLTSVVDSLLASEGDRQAMRAAALAYAETETKVLDDIVARLKPLLDQRLGLD